MDPRSVRRLRRQKSDVAENRGRLDDRDEAEARKDANPELSEEAAFAEAEAEIEAVQRAVGADELRR